MNEVHEILEELVKDDYYVTANNGTKCKIVDINAFVKIKEAFEKYEQDYINEHTTTIHGYTEEYVKKLQQENKALKENAENNDKAVDKVNWDNRLLKQENKQLKNQLKQRDEVIDELARFYFINLWYLTDNDKKSLEEILQKYKGDNK